MVCSIVSEVAGVANEAAHDNTFAPGCTHYYRMDDESDVGVCALGDCSENSEFESDGLDLSNASESLVYEDFGGRPDGSWAQDRRELEASKLSFMRTLKQQQQVDESVRLLLRRLEELPCARDDQIVSLETSDCDSLADPSIVESASEYEQMLRSGRQTQRLAAVAQLLRKGVNMAGINIDALAMEGIRDVDACQAFGKHRTRACMPRPGQKRSSGRADKVPSRASRQGKGSRRGTAEQHLKARSPRSARTSGETASRYQQSVQTVDEPSARDQRMHRIHADAGEQREQRVESMQQQPMGTFRHTEELSNSVGAGPDRHPQHGVAEARPSLLDANQNSDARSLWVPGSNWSPLVPATPAGIDVNGAANNQNSCASSSPRNFPEVDADGVQQSKRTPLSTPRRMETCSMRNICEAATGGGIAVEPPQGFGSESCARVQDSPFPFSCDGMVASDPFSLLSGGSPNNADAHEQIAPWHMTLGADWLGWTVETSVDGELFYYHEGTRTSQWRTPRELFHVLGEWSEVTDDTGNTYWANDLLNMSCWSDPRCTANIFQAAYDGDMFFAQLYVSGKGNLDVVDSSGCTALHYACASSREEMASFLLENGAQADVADLSGCRPLHWACRYSHSEAAKLLLEARVSADAQDSHGDTPLHLAASVNCTDALQWLMKARANPKLRSGKQGMRTPAEVADAAGAHSASDMLRDYERQSIWHVAPAEDYRPPVETTFTRERPSPVITTSSRGPPSSSMDEEELSPARQAVVRVARPLVRGVQWLANRVIPMDDTRTKCWDLGRGAPVLESSRLDRLNWSIPRSAPVGEVIRDETCYDDPFDCERRGCATEPPAKVIDEIW